MPGVHSSSIVCGFAILLGGCGGRAGAPANDDGEASGSAGRGGAGEAPLDEPTPSTLPTSPEVDLPAAPSCSDGLQTQGESDTDCGGPCAPCSNLSRCEVNGDCQSGVCINLQCQAGVCGDRIQNGDERGVDCGDACGVRCPDDFEPCDCAQSEALQALSCGYDLVSWAFATTLGDALIYSVNQHTYRWTATEGRSLLMGTATVVGMSDDGLTALIQPSYALRQMEPILWRQNAPSAVVPTLSAIALSADAGVALSWLPASRGFSLWSPERSLDVLNLQYPEVIYVPRSLSADASVVVGGRDAVPPPGSSSSRRSEPFRWTVQDGFQELGPLPLPFGSAGVVSRDGAVIAGHLADGESSTVRSIFRWTESSGVSLLAETSVGVPTFLSEDGSVLVSGVDDTDSQLRAFRWTQPSGVVSIEDGPVRSTLVTAMSRDGSVLAGHSAETGGEIYSPEPAITPFVWRSERGLTYLTDLLSRASVDLWGWTLGEVAAISGDGRVLMGTATCGNVRSVYRVVLPD